MFLFFVLEAKLESVQVYLKEKSELESRMSELREEMDRVRVDHVEQVKSMEKRGLLEKHRLRNEMIERVNELAHTIRVENYKRMSERSRRLVNEVHASNRELSKQNAQLVDENRTLRRIVMELRAEKTSFREIEQALSRKCVTLQKVIVFKMNDHLLVFILICCSKGSRFDIEEDFVVGREQSSRVELDSK